jgi:hypothetical protein
VLRSTPAAGGTRVNCVAVCATRVDCVVRCGQGCNCAVRTGRWRGDLEVVLALRADERARPPPRLGPGRAVGSEVTHRIR